MMNSPNDADYYDLASEYERVCDELDAIKREWIDPQRIVELAKRYTDQDKMGWVSITFFDHDPTYVPQWQIVLPGNKHSDHRTMAEAIKEAEA